MALSWIILASIVTLGLAVPEVAIIQNCPEVSDDVCTVTEVRIDPCRKKQHCIFYKGTNATMSFDFTPNFSATKLKAGVFWANGAIDVPFADLQTDDGCTFTSCPTESGNSQTLNYSLYVAKKLPKGTFMFKWKLWNEDDETQACCFKTSVQLKKNKS